MPSRFSSTDMEAERDSPRFSSGADSSRFSPVGDSSRFSAATPIGPTAMLEGTEKALPSTPASPEVQAIIATGKDPLAERQAVYDERSLGQKVKERLTGGFYDLSSSIQMSSATKAAQDIVALEQEIQNTDNEQYKQLYQELIDKEYKQMSSSLEGAQATAEQAQTYPRAPAGEALLQAKSFKEGLDILGKYPAAVIGEVGLRSLPQSIPPIVTGILGARAGRGAGSVGSTVGFGIGTGIGSYKVDEAASLMEGLQAAGVNTGNREEIEAALLNTETLNKATRYAKDHALPVALLDGLTAGIATKTLAPAMRSTIAVQLVNLTNQTALQGTGGGAGELIGQLSAAGEIKPGEVLGEIAGEAITAGPDVVAATVSGARTPVVPEGLLGEVATSIEDFNTTFSRLKELAKEEVPGDWIYSNLPGWAYENTLTGTWDAEQSAMVRAAVQVNGLPLSQNPIQTGEVRTFGFDEAVTRANEIRQELLGWQDALGQDLAPEDLTVIEAKVADLRAEAQKNASRVRAEQVVQTKVQGLVEDWVRTYSPDMKILLSSGKLHESIPGLTKLKDTTLGQHFRLDDGTHVLEVNLGGLLQLDQQGKVDEAGLVETVGHEFGHALVSEVFEKSPQFVKDALYNAYKKYLLEVKDMREDSKLEMDYFKLKYPPAIYRAFQKKGIIASPAKRSTGSRVGKTQAKTVGNLLDELALDSSFADSTGKVSKYVYQLSFDEFIANNLAKSLSKSPRSQDIVGRFFSLAANLLKRFWAKNHTLWNPKEAVEIWLENLATETAIQQHQRDFARIGKVLEQEVAARDIKTRVGNLISKAEIGIDKATQKKILGGLDTYNRLVRYGAALTQLAKENPHIAGLQDYLNQTQAWWSTKSNWANRANGRMKDWMVLGKDQADRLGRFLLDISLESDRLGRRLTPEEILMMNKRKKYRLSDDALTVFDGVHQDFRDALGFNPENPTGLYKVLLDDTNNTYRDNPVGLEEALKALNQEMETMADRDYFPLSRFGNYTVKIIAKEMQIDNKKLFLSGDLLQFETYETEKKAKARAEELRKQFPKHTVATGFLDETTSTFVGIPGPLLKALKGKLDLDPTQASQLDDLIAAYSPTKGLKKNFIRRKGLEGFSMDAMRGYASYMQHYANHLSRVKFYEGFQDSLKDIRNSAREIELAGGSAVKRMQIHNHLQRHYDYIMNPGNDLATLRSVAFLWYLGFNVKSAIINLSQVPLVAYPYLAARKELGGGPTGIGDARAVAALGKAMRDVSLFYRRGKALEPSERQMFEILINEGIIDESLATELAAAAEGDVLTRYLPGNGIGQSVASGVRTFSKWGAFPFQMTEKFNRRITALAAYRLAKAHGMDEVKAVGEAREALRNTQYEYAKWNRPAFMRGKAGLIFLFQSYLQNTLYFATRTPGRGRYFMLLLLSAGLAGLPGAEDLLDIFDKVSTKMKTKLGWKNPKVDSRLEIRKFVNELGVNPDLAMHGLGREYGLGPLHALELAGIPVPNMDVSGSLSMGRVVPGLEGLMKPGQDIVGETAKDALGAAVAIPIGLLEAANDPNPDTWKKWEKVMPSAMKSMSRAIRWGIRGEETTYSGARIAEFDVTDPQDFAEIVAQGLGFRNSQLAEEQEKDFMQRDLERFYATRKSMLFAAMDYARRSGDREALADARKRITEYNQTVPFASMKIRGSEIRQSAIDRAKRRGKQEAGLPENRRYTGLYRDVEQGFEEESIK